MYLFTRFRLRARISNYANGYAICNPFTNTYAYKVCYFHSIANANFYSFADKYTSAAFN